MEVPFIFGKIATEKNFTDRENETADLVQNFTSLINTIIISPRRWGKSSLVNKGCKIGDGAGQLPPNLSYRPVQCAQRGAFLFAARPKGYCRHFHKMGGGNRECEEFLFASCSQDFNRYRPHQ